MFGGFWRVMSRCMRPLEVKGVRRAVARTTMQVVVASGFILKCW